MVQCDDIEDDISMILVSLSLFCTSLEHQEREHLESTEVFADSICANENLDFFHECVIRITLIIFRPNLPIYMK